MTNADRRLLGALAHGYRLESLAGRATLRRGRHQRAVKAQKVRGFGLRLRTMLEARVREGRP